MFSVNWSDELMRSGQRLASLRAEADTAVARAEECVPEKLPLARVR